MINRMRHDRSLTSVPPLVELLAIRLSPKAGKSLVIPRGEGYRETLREISISLGQTA